MDSVLFDNRLTPIQASEEIKADTILQFIQHATRPVYSIDPLPVPAEDYGLYFKYNSPNPGFYRTTSIDEYFANLIAQRSDSAIKDPWTLHHALAAPSPDKAALLLLALAAEVQLSEEVRLPAKAMLYRHIAEVWMLAPSDPDQALRYYALASQHKDPNISQSAAARLTPTHLKRLNYI